jgi:inhibitor of KinA sporulation pathway (predicted exonuclease)
MPNEPIEIGLVKYSFKKKEVIDEASFFVKPDLNPTLTDFCKKLTTIQQQDVDGAKSLEEVYASIFDRFVIKPTTFWFSCGQFDRSVLSSMSVSQPRPGGADDKLISPADNPFDVMKHLNIKSLFALRYKLARELSLENMLYHVGEKFEGTQHRGIDDARNIAKLIKHVF